jgi:tight adherence protein B
VTGALLSAALAVLLWPDGPAVRRTRMAAVLGQRAGPLRLPGFGGPLIPLVAAAATALLAALASTPLVAGLAAAAAFLGARVWAAGRRSGRTDARLQALTEGLSALAADLRSGRSLEAATDAAVTTCGDEACGRALARAVRVPGAAPPQDEYTALGEALDRISAAVRLSGRTGCSLAAVVSAVEDDLRARRRHRLELRAATAAPRASALLLAGLPLLGLAMGSGVGADPWAVLTTTGTGQVLLVAGVALEVLGLTWSRRLVRRAVR